MSEQNTPKTLLSLETANTLAGAYARLEQLKAQTAPELVVVGNEEASKLTRDAEIQALVEFLSNGFLNHASEFLGNYFVVQTEYSPLCRALAPIVQRINAATVVRAPIAEAVKESQQ